VSANSVTSKKNWPFQAALDSSAEKQGGQGSLRAAQGKAATRIDSQHLSTPSAYGHRATNIGGAARPEPQVLGRMFWEESAGIRIRIVKAFESVHVSTQTQNTPHASLPSDLSDGRAETTPM
jgi:hypothetical protein